MMSDFARFTLAANGFVFLHPPELFVQIVLGK